MVDSRRVGRSDPASSSTGCASCSPMLTGDERPCTVERRRTERSPSGAVVSGIVTIGSMACAQCSQTTRSRSQQPRVRPSQSLAKKAQARAQRIGRRAWAPRPKWSPPWAAVACVCHSRIKSRAAKSFVHLSTDRGCQRRDSSLPQAPYCFTGPLYRRRARTATHSRRARATLARRTCHRARAGRLQTDRRVPTQTTRRPQRPYMAAIRP